MVCVWHVMCVIKSVREVCVCDVWYVRVHMWCVVCVWCMVCTMHMCVACRMSVCCEWCTVPLTCVQLQELVSPYSAGQPR